jgi:hypothetical protein
MKSLVLVALMLANTCIADEFHDAVRHALKPVADVYLNAGGVGYPVLCYGVEHGAPNDLKCYSCGVGIKGKYDGTSTTPVGFFKVIYKAKDPIYTDGKGKLIAKCYKKDKNNVYGTRIIGLNYIRNGRHLCIHGTNEPNLLPGYVSHMCIRLRNEDVEELYDLLKVGDVIQISEY